MADLQARLFPVTPMDLGCTTAFDSVLGWPCFQQGTLPAGRCWCVARNHREPDRELAGLGPHLLCLQS